MSKYVKIKRILFYYLPTSLLYYLITFLLILKEALMEQEYKAYIKEEDHVFVTLEAQYSIQHPSILWGMNLKIYKIVNDFSIDPENIYNINVVKEGLIRKVEIKYSKFNLTSIIFLEDKQEQIREILNMLGYSYEKIENISYERKLPNTDHSTDMIWIARIYNHYDSDETFLQQRAEISISKQISNALGFEVKIQFVN